MFSGVILILVFILRPLLSFFLESSNSTIWVFPGLQNILKSLRGPLLPLVPIWVPLVSALFTFSQLSIWKSGVVEFL